MEGQLGKCRLHRANNSRWRPAIPLPPKKVNNENDVTMPMATMALTPPPQKLSTVSAPTTPRETQQKEQKNAPNSVNTSSTIRKHSSDSPSVLSDLAAISSLNLQRNGSGSMAHLLETADWNGLGGIRPSVRSF
uniref:Uncharacterized protein n=1 Tax=Globodera pallida TaxID=36090 RepID=A0A183C603_GLOPA